MVMNLGRLTLGALLCAAGMATVSYGLALAYTAWNPVAGVGLLLLVGGLGLGIDGLSRFAMTSYAMPKPAGLSSEDYTAALRHAALPSWACNRCKVVEPGDGLGTCVYCDSGSEFLQVNTEADRDTALAAAT